MQAYDVAEFSHVTLGRKLGSGTYGSVFIGLLPSGRFVAVKQIDLQSDDSEPINREVEVHKQLLHPNIVRYLHSRTEQSVSSTSSQQTTVIIPRLNLYLELVTGGSVNSLMKTLPGGKLPVWPARVYSRHMFLGLLYLHDHGIAHRDVKGDNLLISLDTGTAKLADFDQAKVFQQTMRSQGAAAGTLAGTPFWMAPEVVTEEKYNPFKADVWSGGCTVAEMLTGKAPWIPTQQPMGVVVKLASTQGWPDAVPRDPLLLGGCAEAVDFLDKCFTRDPTQRPDCRTLLSHPFLQWS